MSYFFRLRLVSVCYIETWRLWVEKSVLFCYICGNKMPTRCKNLSFIEDLIGCSTYFGHHYAHHQELESIIQVVAACRICCCPQTGHTTLSSTPYRQLENQAPNTTGSNHLYNTLELLMMGIMVPETCWASNKICNKTHLLHLVGILFPHINDDAR